MTTGKRRIIVLEDEPKKQNICFYLSYFDYKNLEKFINQYEKKVERDRNRMREKNKINLEYRRKL